MKVKGVVFDFGGVMTTTTMPERVRPIVNEIGIDWNLLERGFAKYRRQMDGGFMTLAEMYDLIWRDAGVTLTDEIKAKVITEDRASFLYRNERTLGWMKELKARGFAIGILTNMPPEFVRPFHETFGDFIAQAKAVVISGEERLYKPMREIYDVLADRIGIVPGELCFIDDVEANCQGARDAGWRAIRFISNEQVEHDFDCAIVSNTENMI